MYKTTFFSVIILMLASCASRLAIPDIVGTVYDAKHLKPVANAEVYIDADNNAKTDANIVDIDITPDYILPRTARTFF